MIKRFADPETDKALLSGAHPGEIFLEEFWKPLALSQKALARLLHVSPRRINEIVQGKRQVMADTDLRLTRYFGLSEGCFLRLQTDFELMAKRREIGDELQRIRPRSVA